MRRAQTRYAPPPRVTSLRLASLPDCVNTADASPHPERRRLTVVRMHRVVHMHQSVHMHRVVHMHQSVHMHRVVHMHQSVHTQGRGEGWGSRFAPRSALLRFASPRSAPLRSPPRLPPLPLVVGRGLRAREPTPWWVAATALAYRHLSPLWWAAAPPGRRADTLRGGPPPSGGRADTWGGEPQPRSSRATPTPPPLVVGRSPSWHACRHLGRWVAALGHAYRHLPSFLAGACGPPWPCSHRSPLRFAPSPPLLLNVAGSGLSRAFGVLGRAPRRREGALERWTNGGWHAAFPPALGGVFNSGGRPRPEWRGRV